VLAEIGVGQASLFTHSVGAGAEARRSLPNVLGQTGYVSNRGTCHRSGEAYQIWYDFQNSGNFGYSLSRDGVCN
jgi:hypothetical protein